MGVKAVFFTIDGLFAAILIVLAVVVAARFYIEEGDSPELAYLSLDVINSLSRIHVGELNDPYISSLIANGQITNRNNTIIEQIAEFYVLNKTELAYNLSRLVSERLIPDRFGIEILVNGESVIRNESKNRRDDDIAAFKRMVSGFEKFKPLRGATSKVYLESINEKVFSSYLYFGGFIGQGNITEKMTDIPADAEIISAEIEADVGGDFRLYINNQSCLGLFHPVTNITIAESWNITGCIASLKKGETNLIDIRFSSLLNQSFFAGGFIRADYKTKELSIRSDEQIIRYNFPGIDGVVNLYDAFYVPGTVHTMKIYLHFKANETSYLTIGGEIIHTWNGSAADQSYNITDSNLSTPEYRTLNNYYGLFSNNTIPIRFASYEPETQTITGGNADVILITDFSGSMKKAVNGWGQGNLGGNCNNYFTMPDVRRTLAATCLDKELVNTVMEYTGNRIWPVFIHDNQIKDFVDPLYNNYNKAPILSYIDTYNNGKDKTCIACAINKGYDLLDTYSDNSRKKFIIIMTDGSPTHCASGSCSSNSVVYGAKTCEGLCDTNGACDQGDTPGQCNECTANDGASDNALYSAQRAKNDLNVTIYTIGFGPMDECSLANETMHTLAQIGNGTYQHSKNITELRMIYANISKEILMKVTNVAQTVTVAGNLSKSILYPDSFIEVNYTPIAEQPAFDEIAIAIEEQKFTSCSPSFTIPSGLRVTDAKIVSYSGNHWTESVVINNKGVYNLSSYFLDYVRLGDPFFVYIPVNQIVNGTNTLSVETADSPQNKTGCSLNNTIIYTGLVTSSVAYNQVLPITEGCLWTVEFDDGGSTTIKVPPEYSGTNTCFYTSTIMDYNKNDSYDDATFNLFNSLDYDDDGRIFVNIEEYNLVVSAISVQQIPYPWGPALAEVRVWK